MGKEHIAATGEAGLLVDINAQHKYAGPNRHITALRRKKSNGANILPEGHTSPVRSIALQFQRFQQRSGLNISLDHPAGVHTALRALLSQITYPGTATCFPIKGQGSSKLDPVMRPGLHVAATAGISCG